MCKNVRHWMTFPLCCPGSSVAAATLGPMVFVLYTSVVLQGSTAAIHKCRPRLCEGRQRVLFVTAHPDDEGTLLLG